MAGVTEGYLYFIESDAGDNQNWLHDPDTIVIGNFTEGTDYCKIEIPQEIQKRFHTGITVSHLGGEDFDVKWGNRYYNVLKDGIQTSIPNAELVEKFLMSNRHVIESSFKPYYLVGKYSPTHFWEFTDHDNNRREYCKGVILDGSIIWSDSENQIAEIRLNWHSVW